MPELPEVETVRRRLAPVLEGATIESAEIVDPRLTRPVDPAVVAGALVGDRIVSLDRRGKYLLWRLASGRTLVVHLRMTGSFRHAPGGELPKDAYRRATLALDGGGAVGYRDVRRFGTWELFDAEHLKLYLGARLGPEPLAASFTAARLASSATGRTTPVKAFLLDQRRIAGVGNIYADEALWRAKVHGERLCPALTKPTLARIHDHAHDVMAEALAHGGTSFDALYVNVNGASGYFDRSLHAYGRAGTPCDRCGTMMRREQFMNRSSFSCPVCQPRPRRRLAA